MKAVCETASVFTDDGKNGNGLGVVVNAGGLGGAQMRYIAKKLGFSETSFVIPASKGADYRVRFFTPEKEIPFAGHPSIGTLFVLKQRGVLPEKASYVQKIGARKIALKCLPDGRIVMDQGKPAFGSPMDKSLAAKLLGLDATALAGVPRVVSTGLPHLIIPLARKTDLAKARISLPIYERERGGLGADCIMPFCLEGRSVICRMFAPALGIKEDPATGSGVGPLAGFLVRYGAFGATADGVAEVEVTQGIGKSSKLFAWVRVKNQKILRVEVGGYCRLFSPRVVNIR